jgi:hypothetical protein
MGILLLAPSTQDSVFGTEFGISLIQKSLISINTTNNNFRLETSRNNIHPFAVCVIIIHGKLFC